jgi:hypothetical protein
MFTFCQAFFKEVKSQKVLDIYITLNNILKNPLQWRTNSIQAASAAGWQKVVCHHRAHVGCM